MANEKRLIDANAVLRKMNKRREDFADCWKTYGAMPEIAKAVHGENLECALMISDAPAVDAVPVVHGRWIHDYNNRYGCSECMERETMSPKKLKNYCPNCGAKMDG